MNNNTEGAQDNEEHWGFKRQWGSVYWRSSPGAPPRERRFAYEQPWSQLTPRQRKAAFECLGIANAVSWEMCMPRRHESCNTKSVLQFQSTSWGGLTSRQQESATKHLQITDEAWNSHLSPFHDDLWTSDGISLSEREFTSVLRLLENLTTNGAGTFKMKNLAHFLVGVGKVLTPSQGKLICEIVKASACWPTFYDGLSIRYFNLHVLVGSFLSDPGRFLNLEHVQTFWNDDNGGCSWGCCSLKNPENSYAEALTKSYQRKLFLRLAGRSFLLPTNSANTALPRGVVESIIDVWVADEDPLNVTNLSWVADPHFDDFGSILELLG